MSLRRELEKAGGPPALRTRLDTSGAAAEGAVRAEPGKTRRGGGSSSGKKKNNNDMGDLTEAMAKCDLRNSQKNRLHDASLYDYFATTDAHPLVKCMKEEGSAYGKLVEAERKNHGRGPPQLWKGKAVLRFLSEEVKEEDVAADKWFHFQQAAATIKAKLATIETHPVPIQCMFVTNGNTEGMYEEGKTRVVVGYADFETRILVAQMLTSLKDKIEKHAGAAPADGLERVIQAALPDKSSLG